MQQPASRPVCSPAPEGSLDPYCITLLASGAAAENAIPNHGGGCRVTVSHGGGCRVTVNHGGGCRVTVNHGRGCRVTGPLCDDIKPYVGK
jgi:hypothetical protein